MSQIIEFVKSSPAGVSPIEIEKAIKVSRATINRRLRDGIASGDIVADGSGPSVRYHDADPLRSIRAYFDKPHTERKFAIHNESMLDFGDGFDLSSLPCLDAFSPLGKYDLVKFLVDFSCSSSALEGGSYSLLDTKSLIEYGEKAAGKPSADAFLVLNHKRAFEYLFDNANLNLATILEVHSRIAFDHDRDDLRKSPHFLSREQCGMVREYNEIEIAHSAYAPPFRPGSHYVAKALHRIIDTASSIENPIQAAFYLMTRMPYLQPFVDANKRTSRVICNVPLLNAGLPPISFVDFSKRDYIVSMMAFYELGDTRMASRCFCDAYLKSCARLGLIEQPVARKVPRP